jgi:hypothetical protein
MRTPFCGKPGCEWPTQAEGEPAMQTRAKLKVSTHLLRELLHLPATCEVECAAIDGDDNGRGVVTFVVSDPGLNPVRSGDTLPVVSAEFETHRPVQFKRWVL